MKYSLLLILLICQISYGQDTAKIKELFKQAAEYENKGDFENSITTQIKLSNLDPHNYVSANIIAGLYGKLGKFNEEIQWAGKAIQINPKFSDAYINLGNGYFGSGNLINSEKCFKEALTLDSTSSFPYYSLGVIEEAKKNLKAAIWYYEKSVSLDSTFEDGYFNLAAMYANLKDFKKANANILKVLALDPKAKDAQEMHAHILEELRKKE